MPIVELTDEHLRDVRNLAEATHERFRNVQGHYRNSFETHFVGHAGEVGVEVWARDSAVEVVESKFRDETQMQEADLVLDDLRVEVKTWSIGYWEEWGRCVNPQQLRTIANKADVVIWCTWDEGSSQVDIKGWSTVEEIGQQAIVMTGPPFRQIANHQIPANELNPITELVG